MNHNKIGIFKNRQSVLTPSGVSALVCHPQCLTIATMAKFSGTYLDLLNGRHFFFQLESSVRGVTRAKEELEDQLTAVTLEKDSLHDQVAHLNDEMEELKLRVDRAYKENASLNKQRSELEVKAEVDANEARSQRDAVASLLLEKEDLQKTVEDLHDEFYEAERHRKDLAERKKELQVRLDSCKIELTQVREELSDATATSKAVRESHESELVEIKERHERFVSRQRTQLAEAEEGARKEKEELHRSLSLQHEAELRNVRAELGESVEKSEMEVASLTAELDRLEEAHGEELLVAEESARQAVLLVEQEQTALKEKHGKVVEELETNREELERVKRDCLARKERDQAKITGQSLELSRLRTQLQDVELRLREEREAAEQNLRKQSQDQTDSADQMKLLKANFKYAHEKAESVSSELEQARKRVSQLEEESDALKSEAADSQKKLLETLASVERLEKTRTELKKNLAEVEEDKTQMRKRLQVAEERVSELEDFESSLRSQLEDSRSTQADIESRLRNSEVMLLEAERNTKRTQSRFREMEAEKDRIKVN